MRSVIRCHTSPPFKLELLLLPIFVRKSIRNVASRLASTGKVKDRFERSSTRISRVLPFPNEGKKKLVLFRSYACCTATSSFIVLHVEIQLKRVLLRKYLRRDRRALLARGIKSAGAVGPWWAGRTERFVSEELSL